MIKRYDVDMNFIALTNAPGYIAEFVEAVYSIIDMPPKDIKCVPLLDGSVVVSTINKSVLIKPGDILLYYPNSGRITTMQRDHFHEYYKNLLDNYEV